jgi:hypothetical protein
MGILTGSKSIMADIKLDEETKKALLGVAPFSTASRNEFTPAIYLRKNEDGTDVIPEHARPVFILRPFAKVERDVALRIAATVETVSIAEIDECTRKIVTGWRNLFDAGTGEEIQYSGVDGCSASLWEDIPSMVRGAIFSRAILISGLLFGERLGLK